MDWDEHERARSQARPEPVGYHDPTPLPPPREPRPAGEHRHVLVLHRHPDWHGHCDSHRRGFKRCRRLHWHVWYRHSHGASR